MSAVVVMPLGRRSVITRQPLTEVTMREYGDDEIEASIAGGYPLDKAGAYGIQDELLRPVERYEGCYCNVIGLSLWAAIEALHRAGEEVDVESARFLPQCNTCPLARP